MSSDEISWNKLSENICLLYFIDSEIIGNWRKNLTRCGNPAQAVNQYAKTVKFKFATNLDFSRAQLNFGGPKLIFCQILEIYQYPIVSKLEDGKDGFGHGSPLQAYERDHTLVR